MPGIEKRLPSFIPAARGRIGIGRAGAYVSQVEHFAQTRGSMRYNRIHQHPEGCTHLQTDVHGVGAGLRVACAGVPGLGVVKVLVAAPRQRHRFGDGLAHPKVIVRVGDVARRFRQCIEHSLIRVSKVERFGHGAVEVAIGKGERAVYEVAQHIRQLAVYAVLEAIPREIGVFRLGQRRSQRIAEHVDALRILEVVEILVQPYGPVAAGGELLTLQVQKLVGRHVFRQYIIAVGLEHRRKHEAVEDDVVFPYKVDELGVAVLPVVAPAPRIALLLSPALRDGDVPDGRVEPDVDHFAVGLNAVTLGHIAGHRHAPGHVARDGSRLQAVVEPALNLPAHVVLPLGVRIDPRLQIVLHLIKRQVPVRGLAQLRRGVGQRAARVDQFVGTQRCAALLALITIGFLVAALRARAHYESVGQKHLGLGVIELLFRLEREGVFLVEGAKEIAGGFDVHVVGGAPVVVEAHPEPLEAFFNERMIRIHNILRRAVLAKCPHQNRHPHLVRAAHKRHVAPRKALIPHV